MHRDQGLALALALIVLILPAIAMAGGSVKLSWNANTENDVAGYRIYFGTSSGNYSKVEIAGKATTYTVNDLQEGATYYFVVTAYDNSGNESGYSEEVPVTILDTTPPLISAVAAKNLTTSGATITWTTDEPSDSQVDYGISAGYGASSPLNSQLVTSHSVTLTGLSASATYHYRVNSRDASGRLATSNDYTFITLAPDAAPPIISNISVNSISPNSATIKWTTHEPADSQVEYGQSAAYGSMSPLAPNLQPDHSVVLIGLSASTEYHFRVLSRDGAGNLTASADQTFTTSAPAVFVRRVNAGGAAFTDVLGQAWSADQEYGTGLDWGYEYGQARVQANAIANTEDDVLFQSARTGAGTYRFEVPTAAVYRVKLCFAETQYTSAGQRVFDVTLESNTVIDDLDLAATVGPNAATTYTFDAEVTDGRVTLKFVAVTGEPIVSAIEITSADARTMTDVTPPSALSARLTSPNTLAVSFNEAVGSASAQNAANYSINPVVSVNSATLQNDQRTVLLNTAAHVAGQTYTLTIRNVNDLANPPNVMANAATVNYVYQTDDTTPPRIASVRIDSPTRVIAVFSEQLTVSSAQTAGNYRISDGVSVSNARLAANGLEVELTTSAHQYNRDYQLTVSNVRDRSAAGNVIASNSSMRYRLAGNDNGNGGNGSVVNSLSMGNYRIDSLRVGDAYYVDRSYRVNHISNSKRNALWIRTANADKANDQSNFLEFNLNREADVYIAYDSRASKVPTWLSRDFDKTNDYIGVSETVGRLDLWRGHFLPGRVRLGGNLAGGATNVNSMYVVLIDDLSRPADNSQETPRSFVLYQNYPNPFNPRTEITYYIERESNVVVNIYNSLGQIVRTLFEGRQSQGQHRLTWDARNDDGNSVPSGTYMYTLEIHDQMSSGGVVMSSAISRQSRSMTLLK
jgi:hypothetical protein